jgi:predicted nucleic acid-binding protein
MIKKRVMKKRKLYLDTSVFGYAVNRNEPERQAEANRLLLQIRAGHFVGGFSFVTEEELGQAPRRVAQRLNRKIIWANLHRVRVRSRSQVHELADRYCTAHIIPREYFDDALHVAIATLWRANALVSYNFTHIVRLDTMVEVNTINRREGLAEIFLCQPSEVLLP